MQSLGTLQDLLNERAKPAHSGHILIYPQGNTCTPMKITYTHLYEEAKSLSFTVSCIEHFQIACPILLHFEDHWDTILWFWSVLLAGGLPVLSSPFSNVEHYRHKHIQDLSALLGTPICLTRSDLLQSFGDNHNMHLHSIERLLNQPGPRRTHQVSGKAVKRRTSFDCDIFRQEYVESFQEDRVILTKSSQNGNLDSDGSLREKDNTFNNNTEKGLAMLMLTSGSTGTAKAVQFTHRQLLIAIRSKAEVRLLPPDQPFLNWIGLDHAAGLVEIHLQALWLGVDQIHVSTTDIVSSPNVFLDLLSKHRVCRTFAPNFFLAKLVSAAECVHDEWDLSTLAYIASGGEANGVKTCLAAQELLSKHGAPSKVIVTGFGMTETCAGAIFNVNCPDEDIVQGRVMASLGQCMSGIEMRITTHQDGTRLAGPGEPGDLEVRGPVVFEGYYHNDIATEQAFTPDKWFLTGDRGVIDERGNLSLLGRTKDIININGVKIVTSDIQTALEQSLGSRVSRLIVFASRAVNTEQVTIAYIPTKHPVPIESMIEISRLLTQECLVYTATRPLVFALQENSLPLLPMSALGKISRQKMADLFEHGAFIRDLELYDEAMRLSTRNPRQNNLSPATEAEALLIDDFAKTLGKSPGTLHMSPETCIFNIGFTSMHVIKLKFLIETRLGTPIPIILIMRNSTARSLAAALDHEQPERLATGESPVDSYDPVVVFREEGSKPPLWLIHPGVGEVLVFVELSQRLAADDRPVFALRAAGFEPNQQHFASIEQAVDTYTAAIRRRQPRGPYALAGYSYGAMLAFEVAKRLGGRGGDEVRFLGSLNLPPHIKGRVSQLSWNACLLHLAHFLGLVSEDVSDEFEADQSFCALTNEEALTKTLTVANADRLSELGLEADALARWTNVAFGLQRMAADYDPSGKVNCIDVFHAVPLRAAARSREEWLGEHLSLWADFSREPPKFHAVEGAHYTMIAPENVDSFAKTLRMALRARGV